MAVHADNNGGQANASYKLPQDGAGTSLRAPYALSGTDLAHAATVLARACPGTDGHGKVLGTHPFAPPQVCAAILARAAAIVAVSAAIVAASAAACHCGDLRGGCWLRCWWCADDNGGGAEIDAQQWRRR
eukprot:2483478-Rhodomonas_salina.2